MNENLTGRSAGRISRFQLTFLIFAAVCLVYAVSPQGRPSFSDLTKGAEISRVAMTLAQEGSFAHPFHPLPTGPTAHTAPAYVFLYAAVAKIFGIGWMGARVLWALNIGFLALQLALLPLLSEQLGLGTLPGVIAALLGATVQPYRVLVEFESLFTGALLVLLCVMTVRYFKAPGDPRQSLLFGVLWGVAILTNPECVLLLFVWAHIAAMEDEPAVLARARQAMVVVIAGAALACLPWFVRNYEQFHAVFFVRDNFGIELFTSNNDCAHPTTLENFTSGCHEMTHPNANAALALQVIELGEVRFNHEMMRRAVGWISSNPGAFTWLTARRFARFWFPYLGSYRYGIPMGILTLLSFVGLLWMYRENRAAALLLGATLAVYPLLHYIVQFEARYRYPIFWATLLPAGYAIAKIFRRPREKTLAKVAARKEHSEMSLVQAGAPSVLSRKALTYERRPSASEFLDPQWKN